MSARDNLEARLKFRGGVAQYDRNVRGKVDSLRSAIRTQPYHSNTIIFLNEDNGLFDKKFKALINTEKHANDYDLQIISIPYEDVCISEPMVGKTLKGYVPTGARPGAIFYWEETNSYWIAYLLDKDEKAYFKSTIRECTKQVEFNKHKQWVYYRGPEETTIPWNYKTGVSWNDINYSAVIYITKTQENLDYFHRFNTVKIDGNKWLVKAVDDNSGDGIIEIVLGEDYNNNIEDNNNEMIEQLNQLLELEREDKKEQELPVIEGDIIVYPFDEKVYTIKNAFSGKWSTDSTKIKLLNFDTNTVRILINTGKSGKFNLIYTVDDNIVATLPITIESL